MKIYTGYPGGITKITNDKGFYQTEDLANVISVYVNKADVTGITYTLALEFLRADGRKTTIYTEDSFASGEATTLTEENVTYDIHNFTLTNTQLAVAGALAFTCYINILNSGVVEKRGVLFNAVSNVRKTVTYSANTIFVVSDDDEDVPIIVADMKTAIETLSNQLTGKVKTADIADNLTTNDSNKVLSAKQGYILKTMLDTLDAGKQDVLTFDSTPTANSTNPVTSGGVKTALDAKADKTNTYTKSQVDTALDAKADKTNTYTKSEVNTALNGKADKSTTYTKTETDNLLSAKADKTTVNGIDNRVGALETDIDTLKSVQNVVDVVATKSALNSYNTSKLEENDKIQVIADETHSGASTIYNWNGSAWEYLGAYGGNSYTKTQTDNLLNAKADKSTTYTKTETDTLLNTKADKSTTYTKAEIDTILNTVVIEKSFESLAVDQMTITGYVTQEVLNSIGPRTQVKLRVYDSDNDMTFILTQNSPGTNGYNFKCTFNSPIDADGMIEAEGAIYEDREYSFVLRNIKIYTEAEVDTLLSSKLNKANPTGTGSISMNSGTASGIGSYANGWGATASGDFSMALGIGTTASGVHSVGLQNDATGDYSISHAPNGFASGDYSRALGNGAKAKGDNQTVIGKFNIPDTSSLEIVGCGEAINGDNARLLDANGNEYLKGDLYINTTFTKDANGDLVSKKGTSITELFNNFRWELGSHTLDVTTDTDVAFSKSVPNYAIGCQINKVGGNSKKNSNLINVSNREGRYWVSTQSDISAVINDLDLGTYTISCDFTPISIDDGYNIRDCFFWLQVVGGQYTGDGAVTNVSDFMTLNETKRGSLTFTKESYTNYEFRLWGFGNHNGGNHGIGRISNIMLNTGSSALPYEPYFEGIRDSAVTSVVSKDSNNTTIDTLTIPTAIQNLTGYGWGINDTCYNYIDYDNKKYIQKVGRVDLGTLSWNYSSQYYSFNTTNLANVIKHEISGGVISNLLCRLYTVVTAVQAYTNQINMGVGSNEEGTVFISNSNYSTAQSFKTAMDGVYLYYELDTPVETDISAYLTTDTIDVEPLGTLEFTNTYSQDVPSDIDYLIEEVKA